VNTIRRQRLERVEKTVGERPRILLLPGSRRKEILMNLETMCQAKLLMEKRLAADFSVLKHRDLPPELFAPAVAAGIPVIEGNPFEVFAETDFALACSGTVTVELALSGVPAVVMYKMSPVTYFLAKAMVKVSAISMPNIILGHHVFPELIQDQATPENLAQSVCSILGDREKYDGVRRELKRLYSLLRPFDARLAASEVLSA
jgi:lipid-A-disaccharide synthase